MQTFVVAIADNCQAFHNIIQSFITNYNNFNKNNTLIQSKHFYTLEELRLFLKNKPEFINLLFLDLNLKCNTNNVNLLSDIRKYSPHLLIYIVDNGCISINTLINLSQKYNVQYIQKPISEADFLVKLIYTQKMLLFNQDK